MTNNQLTDEQLAHLAKNLFACGFEVSAPQVQAMVVELQEHRRAQLQSALKLSGEVKKGLAEMIEGCGGEVVDDARYAWKGDENTK